MRSTSFFRMSATMIAAALAVTSCTDGPVAPASPGARRVTEENVADFTMVGAHQTKNPRIAVNDDKVGTIGWGDVTNVFVKDDDKVAYADLPTTPGTSTTQYLKATDFGFNLPPEAVITGIQVFVRRNAAYYTVWPWHVPIVDNSVRLVKNGVIGGADRASSSTWSAPELKSYGGSTDVWGRGWSVADINSASFGVAVSAKAGEDGGANGRRPYIDQIGIRVHYKRIGMPVANAGVDFAVAMTGTTVTATLDGRGSNHPVPSAQLSYTWTGAFEGGTATGPTPTVQFTSAGARNVFLTVSDGEFTDKDTVRVNVIQGTPPISGTPASVLPTGEFTGSSAWFLPSGSLAEHDFKEASVKFEPHIGTGLSEVLESSNFRFQIPVNATITGIVVTMQKGAKNGGFPEAWDNDGLISDYHVRLMKDGGSVGSDRFKSEPWPGMDTQEVTYGSASDRWGRSWTPAEINASGFGVSLQVAAKANILPSYAYVDRIRITVHYTAAAEPAAP